VGAAQQLDCSESLYISNAGEQTAPLPAPDHPMLSLDNNFRLFIELKVFSHDGEALVAFVNTSYKRLQLTLRYWNDMALLI